MDRIENIKKASYLIGKVGKVFQIVFGIFTGMFLRYFSYFSNEIACFFNIRNIVFVNFDNNHALYCQNIQKNL